MLTRGKLYAILSAACLTGYIWIFFTITSTGLAGGNFGVCIIKHATNIPCPSCGSTRSVLALLQGDLKESLLINPIGILIALIMAISPFWIIYDLSLNRKTLFNFYQQAETLLRKPPIGIPLILLVIMNWVWNITKGL